MEELVPEDEENNPVFEMIRSGNTQAIFQLESEGMTQVFTGMEDVNFETLIAGIALYRYHWSRAVVKLSELLEHL